MTPKEKAIELASAMMNDSIFELTNEDLKKERKKAKERAEYLVDEIIEALFITTGHCELMNTDQEEVNKDIAYWKRVCNEINDLK